MSRRTSSTKRIERRAEREAKRPGTQVPRPQRVRADRPAARKTGGFRTINWAPIVGGLAVLLIVGYIVYAVSQTGEPATEAAWIKAMNDSDTSLPGAYVQPHPGKDGVVGSPDDRDHLQQSIPICTQAQLDSGNVSDPLCYTSNPPTSGPHNSSPMPFKVLDNPAPRENLIHNMEHGGVVVWYNTSNQDVINQLKSLVQDELDKRRLVVMSQYTDMEADTIAVTSWTRIDKFSASDYTKKRVQDFIETHNKRFNPEGF